MPIAAAIAIAGVAGAGASIIASNNASRTARRTAEENNRIAAQNRTDNIGLLQPWTDRGNAAGAAYNALLGLGGPAQFGPAPMQSVGYAEDLASADGIGGALGNTMAAMRGMQRPVNAMAQPQPSTVNAARDAFNNFLNSTGYQFRVGEGERRINAGYAGRGMLQSGAALRELTRFGQGIASDEFGRYMGYLDNQQRLGANALSGLVSNNNNASDAIMGNNNMAGQTAANAALATGGAINNLLSNAVNAYGISRGSSYGGNRRMGGF